LLGAGRLVADVRLALQVFERLHFTFLTADDAILDHLLLL
jgi:hypothetical protein